MRRLLALALTVVLAGCGGGDAIGIGAKVTGTWELRTINGSLPYSFAPENGWTTTYTGSTLTVSENGTFSEITAYRQTNANNTVNGSLTDVGTWQASGGAVTFNDQTNGGSYKGSVTGNALTTIIGTYTLVYQRR